VGALMLSRLAYAVRFDATGMTLALASGEVRVAWDAVRSYRKIGVTWGWRVVNGAIEATIFVVVAFTPDDGGPPRRVAFWVVAYGPAFERRVSDAGDDVAMARRDRARSAARAECVRRSASRPRS
jgi:hypothetical protein